MIRLVPSDKAKAVLLAVLVLVSACSKKTDEYVERPVEELYNAAMDLLDANEYFKAAQAFDEVDRQHPYSAWATKAQLMGAYALYERNKYDDAIIALDRFIQLHPGNRDIAYAYYLKGLSYYEQITDVARDQALTEQAMKTLQEVVDRFPNSSYARDARLKLDLARDHMAGKEMAVGRYYLKIKQYLAALNRFKVVAEQYQTTTHVPEALHRMVEIYTILGLEGDAQRVAAVLGHNFPGNEWYDNSYAVVERGETDPSRVGSRSWVDKLKFWSKPKPVADVDTTAEPPAESKGWLGRFKFW